MKTIEFSKEYLEILNNELARLHEKMSSHADNETKVIFFSIYKQLIELLTPMYIAEKGEYYNERTTYES